MKYNLPNRDECQKIVNCSKAFYCTNHIIEGQIVELYDYRLASITDYVNNNAFELRGLCFVQRIDGSWERNILLNKFFNINETKLDNYSWMLEDVQNKKIMRVQNKEDGSLISFIKFQNGNIRAKSKMSFDSDQAKMAQELYNENENIQNFVQHCFSNKLVPIFEIVSPFNQIVLQYQDTELKLLQIRKESGEYLNKIEFENLANKFNILTANEFSEDYFNFSKLQELQSSQENIEGCVVTLEDGQMLKIKTQWYFQMHGLTTNSIRENLLIESILEDSIDDVISLIPDGQKKDFIIKVSEKIQRKFNHLVVEYKNLRGLYFNKFKEKRKEFAIEYKNHELFSYVMRGLNTSFREVEQVAESKIKEYILNKCRTLTEAKKFIDDL